MSLRAEASAADHILLDAGAGTGTVFDWSLLHQIRRPYFLAGGLGPENVAGAVERLHPYAVDVSSGIETDGGKDPEKMAAFVAAVEKGSESMTNPKGRFGIHGGTVYPRDADERGH